MKNLVAKKPQTTLKTGSLVKKSKVQKPIVKKKPIQTKQKNLKLVDDNVSIKDKLSGKFFSPTVEKAKNVKPKKIVQNSSSVVTSRSSPAKLKIAPTDSKNKLNKTKCKVEEVLEKTVLPVAKNKKTKSNIKNATSNIEKKLKNVAPKGKKSVNIDEQKVEVKDVKNSKRKIKSEVQTKKLKNKEVKVERDNSPVSLDVKQEDQNIVADPGKAKRKRKSSLICVKDLKPISNIKSLEKRPVKKISKAQIKKKLTKFPERGVCYFSHIPHGFYEKELKKYCSQFGEVTGVYHPVSKSGNSRGYAFVEFKHKEVAEVVAEAMNNYLMFNRLLKCKYIPPESQKPWVFKQDRNNMKAAALRRQENLKMKMRNLSKDEIKKWKQKRQKRVQSIHKKLDKLGLDYEFQVNDPSEDVQEENDQQ